MSNPRLVALHALLCMYCRVHLYKLASSSRPRSVGTQKSSSACPAARCGPALVSQTWPSCPLHSYSLSHDHSPADDTTTVTVCVRAYTNTRERTHKWNGNAATKSYN